MAEAARCWRVALGSDWFGVIWLLHVEVARSSPRTFWMADDQSNWQLCRYFDVEFEVVLIDLEPMEAAEWAGLNGMSVCEKGGEVVAWKKVDSPGTVARRFC